MAASGNRLISPALAAYIGCSGGKRGPRWRQPRCSPAGPAGGWAATRRPWPSAGSSWPPWSWPPPPGSPTRWCWSPPRATRPGGLAARAVADPGAGAAGRAWPPPSTPSTPATSWSWPATTRGCGWSCSPTWSPWPAAARRWPAGAAPAWSPWSRCTSGPRRWPPPGPGWPTRPATARSAACWPTCAPWSWRSRQWRPLDPDGRSFVDLDDPADLAAWDAGPR